MKIIVTDPKGFFFNRQKHAKGAEIELPAGARLDAALHFKQVEIVKEKSKKADIAAADPDGAGAPAKPSAAAAAQGKK